MHLQESFEREQSYLNSGLPDLALLSPDKDPSRLVTRNHTQTSKLQQSSNIDLYATCSMKKEVDGKYPKPNGKSSRELEKSNFMLQKLDYNASSKIDISKLLNSHYFTNKYNLPITLDMSDKRLTISKSPVRLNQQMS